MVNTSKSSVQRRPLAEGESLEKTLGCRHSNANICRNHSTPNKCAFVRTDGFCVIPPKSWKGIYLSLVSVSD